MDELELAAYAGHPAASAIKATSATPNPWEWDVKEWVRGLSRWGKSVAVRAAIASARHALPWWKEAESQQRRAIPMGDAPVRAIEAAEAWLACPCVEHANAAAQAATTAWDAREGLQGTDAIEAAAAACHAAEAAAAESDKMAAGLAADATHAATIYMGNPLSQVISLRAAIGIAILPSVLDANDMATGPEVLRRAQTLTLERFFRDCIGGLDETTRARIAAASDEAREEWLDRVAVARTPEEVFEPKKSPRARGVRRRAR